MVQTQTLQNYYRNMSLFLFPFLTQMVTNLPGQVTDYGGKQDLLTKTLHAEVLILIGIGILSLEVISDIITFLKQNVCPNAGKY